MSLYLNKSLFIILLVINLFYSSIISFSSIINNGTPFLALFLVFGICILKKEHIFISLLLISICLFGNRPTTDQSFIFINILNICSFFFSIKFLFKIKEIDFDNFVLFLFQIFILTSFFSILNLNLELFDLKNLFFNLEVFNQNIFLYLKISEFSEIYSILRSFLNLQIFILSFYIVYFFQLQKIFLAIFSGLLISLFFGILDYHNLINLSSFRTLDPVVNFGNTQYRLQSFFGHSGWLAEYITLCIPITIILMNLKIKKYLKISLIALIMIIGEYVLILTYQRGGWISYPFTIFITWAAIFYSLQKDLSFIEVFKKSILKILICLPITLIISIFLITIFSKLGDHKSYYQDSLVGFKERFKEIGNTSDRTNFIKSGFILANQNPIFGGGSEGYGHLYESYFENEQSKLNDKFDLPLHGSAHNAYAQIASGNGYLGLLLILSIILLISFSILKDLKNPKEQKDIYIKLSILCFNFAFLFYGIVQEIFYIVILQFISFIFILSGIKFSKFKNQRYNFLIIIIIVCLIPINQITKNSKYLNINSNCYSEISNKNFSWCPIKVNICKHKNYKELKLEIIDSVGSKKVILSDEYNCPNMLVNTNNDYFIQSKKDSKSKDNRVLSQRIKIIN